MKHIFTHATSGPNNSVIYTTAQGQTLHFTGGSRNWRNQNPGNVRSNGIKWVGKIGEAGGFCVFATPEHGKRVIRKILANRLREGKTLAQALHSYAPTIENNTNAYIHHVSRRTGIAPHTPLAHINAIQLEDILEAICLHEGSAIGTITLNT